MEPTIRIEPGVLLKAGKVLAERNVRHPFLVMDENTKKAAGQKASGLLQKAGIRHTVLCFPGTPRVLPNEEALEQVLGACPEEADLVLGVGSGVINDLCKMCAKQKQLSSGIIATAPSMDGYASNSAAMELRGIKTTVYTKPPQIILCDTEVLRMAPMEMLESGFGDMAAKIISIADWRIARYVTDEFYSEEIANMTEEAFRTVLKNADGILRRDEVAIRHMTEGLVLSGTASTRAGVSRPASGMEHTVSHLLEMFALARGMQPASHGIQVGYGTRIALKLYADFLMMKPSEASIQKAADDWDPLLWKQEMHEVFGDQADALIDQAVRERRNDPEEILWRGKKALSHLDEILHIVEDVTRQAEEVNRALDRMHIPQMDEPERMGYTKKEAENAVLHSRDLRARYIFTSLLFDLGCSVRAF